MNTTAHLDQVSLNFTPPRGEDIDRKSQIKMKFLSVGENGAAPSGRASALTRSAAVVNHHQTIEASRLFATEQNSTGGYSALQRVGKRLFLQLI